MEQFKSQIDALDKYQKFAYGLKLLDAIIPYIHEAIREEISVIFDIFHFFDEETLKAVEESRGEVEGDIMERMMTLSDSEHVVEILRDHLKEHEEHRERYAAVALHGLYIFFMDAVLNIHEGGDPLHLELTDIALLVGLVKSGVDKEFLLERLDHGYAAIIDFSNEEEKLVLENIVTV